MHLSFDRGTLLLKNPSPESNPLTLPGVLWDERVKTHRAPPIRYSAICQSLKNSGITFNNTVRPPAFVPKSWKAAPIELRPYQSAALDAWMIAENRGIAALPTGSGKTWLAIAAMAKMQTATLCLVPTRVLLSQWHTLLSKIYPGPIGVYGDGARELAPITIATFESAYRHMETIGNHFDLLIIDEVHHFGAGMRDEALEMSIAPYRLGLTATLPSNEIALSKLNELIGPVVYELTISDLRGSFLADFEIYSLQLDLTSSERRLYELEMNAFRSYHQRFREACPEASWKDFVRMAARTEEGRRALAAIKNARRLISFTTAKAHVLKSILSRHIGKKALIFTADVKTAYQIARTHLIMPLTSDISRTERDDVLKSFKDGKLHSLVSCRVLNEGLDVPDAEIAIIVGGAMGEREQIQRIGRLLRPRDKKKAIIYELICRNTIEVRQWKKRNTHLAP